MLQVVNPILKGTGYFQANGSYANVQQVSLVPPTTLAAGQNISGVFEVGDCIIMRLICAVTAKSGTNPTLDAAVQTSKDGVTSWRSMGAFRQKSNLGAVGAILMEAVVSTGTTPPVITLTGTATEYIDLLVQCTTLGALGTSVIRYSTDGGVSWTSGVVTAATINVLNSAGLATGLVLNIAAGNAAIDNVWTSKAAGYEEKVFAGCDRFVRIVTQIGGSASPTVTASITGEVS